MNEITVFGNDISEAEDSDTDDTDNASTTLILVGVLVGGVLLVGLASLVYKRNRVSGKQQERRQETELGVVSEPKLV